MYTPSGRLVSKPIVKASEDLPSREGAHVMILYMLMSMLPQRKAAVAYSDGHKACRRSCTWG